MFKKTLILLVLALVSSAVAFGVYMLLFGIWFGVNGTYFPETRAYHTKFASSIEAVTWVASFSTISLAYVLYRNRKENK